MTTISDEHKALVASLVEGLQEMELKTIQSYYEALRESMWTLAEAMDGKYHVDALPAVAALFDELLDAVNGVCGSVSARFFREVLDEDGEIEDNEEVKAWEEATYATIFTREVNCSPAPRFPWAETFAADVVASCIEQCISGWEYSEEDTDHDSYYQDFSYRK